MIKNTKVILVAAALLLTPISPALAVNCYNPQPSTNLSGCAFVGIDLSGYDLSYTDLSDTDLTNTNLSDVDLTGVKSGGIKGVPSQLPEDWMLIGGYLFGPGANLHGARLSNLNLSNVNLTGAQLTATNLSNLNLNNANLTEANLGLAQVSQSNLTGANLTRATLGGAGISFSNISEAIFRDAVMDNLYTSGNSGDPSVLPTDWVEAEGFLIGPKATLTGNDLINLDFRTMNISGASLSYANISGSNFNGVDFSTVSLKFTTMSQSSLEGADLSQNDLEGLRAYGVIGIPSALPPEWKLRSGFLIGPKANLSTLNLSNVNLSGTNLAGASLAAANLTNANLAGVDLRETVIQDANLTEANIEQTNLTGVSLRGLIAPRVSGTPIGLDPQWQYVYGYLIGPGANLTSVDFSNLDLTGVNLVGVNFVFANLSGVDLTDVDLTGVNLTGVNLTGAILEGTNLTGATLFEVIGREIVGTPINVPSNWRFLEGLLLGPKANLSSADLRGLDLRNLDLTGAFMASADLTGADLRGTKLTGASMQDTNLTGANLLNVITGNVTGTPSGLPQNFSFADGSIKGTIFLSPTPKAVGLARVGSKLTAIAGNWDVGVTLSYQWYRNGFQITGATTRTYSLAPADYKKGASVRVTGTGTGGVSKTKTSLQALVGLGAMATKAPKITGVIAKGKTVTVASVPWVPGAKISYSWLLDGKPIKGATKNQYKILATQVGKKLSVLVKQTALGYTAASKASAAVKVK